MEECWYCHWGWAAEVWQIYARAKADIDALGADVGGERAMHFGPAHVVWEDENWDSTAFCIGECDEWLAGRLPNHAYAGQFTPEVLAIIRRSLVELAALPEAVREPCPAGYDGERPERFPPPAGMTMVKREGR